MKVLVLLGVFAAALAHPLPDADCVYEAVVPGALPYAAAAPLAYGAAFPYHLPHAHLTYAAATPVHLPPAEVKVPVTQTHVEVPVHKQIHYGTQSYVAGHSTSIHKPALVAPAIAPPSTLLSKVSYKAPEVTVQHQEIPVEKHVPNYVEKPYHAGTIVQYTAPEVKQIEVPTPVGVPHPVPVPQPVAVQPVQYGAVAPAVAVAAPAVAPAVLPAVAPAVQYAAVAHTVDDDC